MILGVSKDCLKVAQINTTKYGAQIEKVTR